MSFALQLLMYQMSLESVDSFENKTWGKIDFCSSLLAYYMKFMQRYIKVNFNKTHLKFTLLHVSCDICCRYWNCCRQWSRL
jgi:hypothetical protein